MEKTIKAKWGLAIPPLQRILRDLEFETKKEAQERARQENSVGEYRGRGVKAVSLIEYGGKG